jgi:VCBS repeat-containing protein
MSNINKVVKRAIQGFAGMAGNLLGSPSLRVPAGIKGSRKLLRQRLRGCERLETRDLLASIIMQSLTADGGTQLSLTYEVQSPVASIDVGFYRSADSSFGDDTLLDTVTLNSPADLTLGVHVKALAIGGGTNQVALPGAGANEVAEDYSLLAVANPSVEGQESTALFAGVYHAPAGGVFVHGRNVADAVTIDSSYRVTLNGTRKTYAASDLTGFIVRTHEGNDVVNGSTAAKLLWADGGAGDDTLTGGTKADTLLGGSGDDVLTGGGGNDSLEGGEGSDSYLVSGTSAGTDIYKDYGTEGSDSILAGANGTTISLGTAFSAAVSGIEEISGNGFTGVNLLGTSNVDSLDFSGISLIGLAMIDGLAKNDVITGSDGDDIFRGGTGNDSIDGGAGRDIANFAGLAASYSVIQSGGVVQVKDLATTTNGNDGTDSLQNVEILRFLDLEIDLTPPANAAPVAEADAVTVDEDAGEVDILVLANDTDADTDDTLTVISVDGTSLQGSVAIAPDGTQVIYSLGGAFQYLADGETATEVFTYTIADTAGEQSTASVTVAITGVNDGPVAVPDTLSVSEDAGAVIAAVLANDIDVDAGDTRRVVSVNSTGVRGVVQIPSGGTGILFYPNKSYEFLLAGQFAIETITYTMADSAGAVSTSTLVVTVTGANDGPLAVADAVTISENDGSIPMGVLANDTDVDFGDTKTVVSIDGSGRPASFYIAGTVSYPFPVTIPAIPPLMGTVTILPNGQGVVYSAGNAFQYLKAGQTATDQFLYTMADSAGAESANWVTVTVTGANDAPLAHADLLTVAKNAAPITINVLANDSDADAGDSKTVIALDTTGMLGTATVSADGKSVIYAVGNVFLNLAPGQSATETFHYTMVDGSGLQSSATVTILVTGDNQMPVAAEDSGSAIENGQPVTIDVLANDTDADVGDTKKVIAVVGTGLQGTVSVASGGAGVIYTVGNAFQSLAAGASATETFRYTMQDAGGAQSTATVTVTVTGTNDSPVAVANTATAAEDGAPVVIDVLANDSDVDMGDTKTVISVTSPATFKGSVSVVPGGTGVVYTIGSAFQNLQAGALATETFSYTMLDGSGVQSTANVTVSVTGVNDSPVAVANVVTVSEDAAATTILVLANDTDADVGDTKRVASVQTAGLLGSATVAANGTGIIYTVGNAYQYLITGQTATETFTYTMADAAGALSTATVTVTITGATDGPKAVNDVASAAEDGGPIVINVLGNDLGSDLNPGETLTITSIDGTEQFASITLILIYGVGVGQLNTGTPRLLGEATISPDGRSILYTPLQSLNAGEIGTDTFRYSITGSGGGVSTGTVIVTVTGANDAPIATDDHATVASDSAPLTLDVLANDTDLDTRIDPIGPVSGEFPDGGFFWSVTPVDVADTKTVVAVNTSGLQGSVAIAPGGAGVVYSVGGTLLEMPFGTLAAEIFTYTMQDSAGAQSTATVRVDVTGVNRAPTALNDLAAAAEDGGPVTIDVLANDSDADLGAGDSLSLVGVAGSGLQGTVEIEGTNVVYSVGNAFQSLGAGAIATESFSYTVADTGGTQASANVTLTVIGVNDPPVAAANSATISEDAAPTEIAVLADDTDVDAGDTKTIVAVNGAGLQGSVTISPDGSRVIYTVGNALQTLNAGQTATETFTYTMADSSGALATASVTITVVGANEPVVYVYPPSPPPGAIVGTPQDDTIVTAALADIIYGMAGDDEIRSGGGNDTIYGGADGDALDGGAGNDILSGGADSDDLIGGLGADVFLYYLATESTVANSDKIKDFKASEGDKIDLSFIDASTAVGGNNDFALVSSFTRVAGQLVITTTSSGVYWVQGDVNGDGVADLQIEVRSDTPLTDNDFRF